MKGALGFASILLLAATASLSSAAGVVSLNWDTCSGPTDKTPLPAAPAQKSGLRRPGALRDSDDR